MQIKEGMECGDLDIAVVGMALRVPGADSCAEFWDNLWNGKISNVRLSKEQLLRAGIKEEIINDKNYVNCAFKIADIDKFDAQFFGFTPKEAEYLDPQQRLMLQTAWHALEDAGEVVENDNKIGVFVGQSMSQYLMKNIFSNVGLDRIDELRPVWIENDLNYAATMLSYKLNLRGPSMTVLSACSTSLLAVQQACQSLLNYECEVALAGGCKLAIPQDAGYMYMQGEIASPDGECRPFDKNANGTVLGSGVGIVVLKRLEDALDDGNQIIAVIKGAAANNDGNDKVGYTAPSVKGESKAIQMAHIISEVDPETITYVETHGTATNLGDLIEIQALTDAFRQSTEKKQYCALGAVKANIGHLDTASGIAGFIKTCLVLKNKKIPPNPNFDLANPQIDFGSTPFFIQKRGMDWNPECGVRRAGVSSFGFGGTNVHIVLEEAIERRKVNTSEESYLLAISAKTEKSLVNQISALEKYVKEHDDIHIGNVAYTLDCCRKDFKYRTYITAKNKETLMQNFSKSYSRVVSVEDNNIAFMFPGQGTQYLGMGRELYRSEVVFKKCVDECARYIKTYCGIDVKELIFGHGTVHNDVLMQTQNTQIALFVVEYSLAKLILSVGIKPKALIGHSIGEYVAACISGVMTLEEALMLVIERGRIMQSLPKGKMLSVQMSEVEARKYLNEKISFAVVNSDELCVLSGESDAIDKLSSELGNSVPNKVLHVSHAFHSHMMQQGAEEFGAILKRVNYKEPKIPYLSNVTGDWIRQKDVFAEDYWVNHMVGTVKFFENVKKLGDMNIDCLIESGSGDSLSKIVKNVYKDDVKTITFIPPANNSANEKNVYLNAVGQIWCMGGRIKMKKYFEEEGFINVSLPGYAFEKKSYWIPMKKLVSTVNTVVEQIYDVSTPDENDEDQVINYHCRNYVEPNNELEAALKDILEDVMGIHPIGVTDNFLEIGGHSLIATQVISRIRDLIGVEVKMSEFMENQTIRDVSDLIYSQLEDE